MNKYEPKSGFRPELAHPKPINAALSADAAHNYIREMLVELSEIAEGAQLKDLAALLNVTVTAVETNGRFL